MKLTELQKELIHIIKINNKLLVDQITKEYRKILREELEFYMSRGNSQQPRQKNEVSSINNSQKLEKFKQLNENKIQSFSEESFDDLNFDLDFDNEPVPLVDSTPFYNENGNVVNPERLAKSPQAKQVLDLMQTDYSNFL